MSDFFGGILDDLRGVVSDGESFFDTTLGSALARGLSGGSEGPGDVNKLGQANSLSRMYNVPQNNKYGPTGTDRALRSVDANNVEYEWLQRMRRFAALDDNKVTLGKPQ